MSAGPATTNRDQTPGWAARFGWILGLVTFAICMVIGFGVGFVAGRTEPTKRAEKPRPEVAVVTTKSSGPNGVKAVASAKVTVAPATAVKPAPTPATKPATPPTKAEASPPKVEAKKPDPKPELKKPEAKADAPTFAKVAAVFKDKCVICHGAVGNPKGGLDLRTMAAINKGGESGSSVTPGDLAKSPLWDSIDSGQMPPPKKEPLTADEKKLIRDWILGGAK